jgi:NADPH:quinone reductase-like Zn-dependent oxidoreductase
MRAAQVHEIGSPPQPVDVADRVTTPGKTLVAVAAASLNPVELRVAAGRMPGATPPYIPGLEGVGTVLSSETHPVGTRVRFENDLPGFGSDGCLAELAIADDEAVFPLPSEIADTEAAAAGVVGITAELAFRLAGMREGERVAVLAATGGVGRMAVQLAAARGAGSVVAVGRDPATLDELRSQGATATVALSDGGELPGAIQAAAGGAIDVVVDPLWGQPAMAAIESLGERGRLVNVGNTAGSEAQLPLQAMRKVRSAVLGLSSGWAPMPEKVEALSFVVEQIVAGKVSVSYEVMPLAEIGQAWSRQEGFPHTKLVVSMA